MWTTLDKDGSIYPPGFGGYVKDVDLEYKYNRTNYKLKALNNNKILLELLLHETENCPTHNSNRRQKQN